MRDLAGRLDLCSINTATLGHQAPIGAMIEAVAKMGFGGIAPWRRDLEGEDVAAVARQIRETGLRVSGLCRSTYFPAASAAGRQAAIDDNRRAVDQAAELGAACFVLVVGSLPEESRDLPRARQEVEEGIAALLPHARAAGVRLALEPLHPVYAADRSAITTITEALDLAERVEPVAEHLGLAVDAYHVWWDPALAPGIARAGRDGRLFALHICDWLRVTRDPLTDRGMMGDGVIDLPALRGMVEDAGYEGAVEVEIFSSHDWWRRPMEETLAVTADRLQTVC
ncbi:MAG: sugar phosphate isomerase/epimerase family protein [Pseudomonadota bacterium]